VAHLVQVANQFGTVTGPVRTDMAEVRSRKQAMIEREIAAHLNAYATSGAELIMGSGRFVAPKTIEVRLNDGGTRLLQGDRVFVNVGSHAPIPNVPGLESARPLTHIDALELDSLPRHLIVLGGGYTGLEIAQAYCRFGSRMTIIEPGRQLMGREDPDVAQEMQSVLSAEGIRVLVGATPTGVDGRPGYAVTVTVSTPSGEQKIEGSDILVVTGRIPNTAGIGLEEAGIELDARGYIRVNERLETTAPGVWAIGECAGSPQFTHVSVDDFPTIRDNLTGGHRSTEDRLIPYCVFTDPPLAHVGLSEAEAQRQGIPVRVAKLPMSNVLRTEATGETQGFMKVLVSESDDRILGFTIIGSGAGKVIAAVQTAMLANLPYSVLRDAVITRLTIAEGLGLLLANVSPRGAQKVSSESTRMASRWRVSAHSADAEAASIRVPDGIAPDWNREAIQGHRNPLEKTTWNVFVLAKRARERTLRFRLPRAVGQPSCRATVMRKMSAKNREAGPLKVSGGRLHSAPRRAMRSQSVGATAMPLLVTSASGANGNGHGALLAFDDRDGKPLGVFSEDSRIMDPRGMAVDEEERLVFLNSADRVLALDAAGKVVRDSGVMAGLNPGGGTFGPEGRYYVGLRSARTILALQPDLRSGGEHVLPAGIVPFPRGFGFNPAGRLFLSSGIGPGGEGDDAIVAFAPADRARPSPLVAQDPDLSPLDLTVAPNGNILVSSERPFGAPDAVTTVREYDPEGGRLVRVFSADGVAAFRKPRGLRFGPGGKLYCAAQDEVVAFDFRTGSCLGAVVRFPRLYGQALIFFPR